MVFLDTSFLLALEFSKDANHDAAVVHWAKFTQAPEPLMTTALVFAETTTFLKVKGFHKKAVEVGERLLHSRLLETVHLSDAWFSECWKFFQHHQDKRYSFADCFSFVLMKKRKLRRAFTFDHHFAQAGFLQEP